jgi:hypothetical protein
MINWLIYWYIQSNRLLLYINMLFDGINTPKSIYTTAYHKNKKDHKCVNMLQIHQSVIILPLDIA